MNNSDLDWIANYIWSIADDVLRDLYVRGKYRDVILPMIVLRRLDVVLEGSKQAVLDMKVTLDKAKVVEQDAALRQAAGHAFYNVSQFTLRDLQSITRLQQLEDDFRNWLDGFSPNVQDILNCFGFRHQVQPLSDANALGSLIEKITSTEINLGPHPVKKTDGTIRHPGLDNHAMGTIFEELVRRFNEENNEEAGDHWTPRDAVQLMAKLVFLPIADGIESGTYLLYDGACGTGGMLTVGEETLKELANERGKQVSIHLYGQEINAETYAICKADLLLKGEGKAADNIVGGPKHSTLANDAFKSREFDFMLSNPPYGKKWKIDLERMGGKSGMDDPRFIIEHDDDPEYSLVTRVNDGQMLFLANKLSKMKQGTKLGSRIAEVHNGSSLFTGDAGSGESNIRRWIIENDWLEAIIALPLNLFYNTGIATYVWVLTNRKPDHRGGKVQLIDATSWYQPLRKSLGQKNCELGEEDIARICDTFLAFEENEHSKIFDNPAFGYWKITVERPLRIKEANPDHVYKAAEIKKFKEDGTRSEDAPPVIKKIHKRGTEADPLHGLFETTIAGKPVVVEYEPDTDLRDTEQIPLLDEGGVEAFLRREVLPYAADAWYQPASVKIGYEISFNRYFYKPQPMRTMNEIRADILALESETEGLLDEILGAHEENASDHDLYWTGGPFRVAIKPLSDSSSKSVENAIAIMEEFCGACQKQYIAYNRGINGRELAYNRFKEWTKKGKKNNRFSVGKASPKILEDAQKQKPGYSCIAHLSVGEMLDGLVEDGTFETEHAKALVVMIYTLWEGSYRSKIAEIMNVKPKNVTCELMNDVRRVRHCIIHKKGIVQENFQNKLALLSKIWSIAPGELKITENMLYGLMEQINALRVEIKSYKY